MENHTTEVVRESTTIVKAVLKEILAELKPKKTRRKNLYSCDKCDYVAKDNFNLQRHKDNMHCPMNIQCLKCKLIFLSKYEYIQHNSDCVYLCPYVGCSETFKIDYKFEAHKRGHLERLRRLH